ncbi:MAG: hypothetical protein NWE93_11810 [Candidatus Bathyarchaeota archaeon]|nr:hypothetical protein [Candidatus Bathyarchaeota archaeon]
MIKTKKGTLAILLLAVAAVTLFWSVGVESDFFANPAFSAFFWLSNQDAHNLAFFIPSLGGAALLFGISYWSLRKEDI